jgi:5'-methylthioadenosine phosphorylase
MNITGIISGTLPLQKAAIPGKFSSQTVQTAYGEVLVMRASDLVMIQRHSKDRDCYILPHRINHAANLSALKALDVTAVISVNSTGSLKQLLSPGAVVIPDDFILLQGGPTVIEARPIHITPALDEGIRDKLIAAARRAGVECLDGGVYWQTQGPRLETRAEIRLMSQFADIVGMTMASEAVIAQELDIPFASICSVDNYAHGIGGEKLSIESVLRHARANTERIISVINHYLERERT